MLEKPDRLTIRQFVAFLRTTGREVQGVDDWPEDHIQGGIDALAGSFAIQHASFDALPGQRTQDAMFTRVVANLEAEFHGKLGFCLQLTFDFNSVRKGQDWKALNRALRRWLSSDVQAMTTGHHRGIAVPGLPFAIDACKGALDLDGVWFARRSPDDVTLANRLTGIIRRPGRKEKLQALLEYRGSGKVTLLLLENSDIALMNDALVAEAFETAFDTWPHELDELWFVHRVGQTDLIISDLLRGQTWIFDVGSHRVTTHNGNTAAVSCKGRPQYGRQAQ